MSEQSVRTTSVPKLASLSQDDLELRENTGGLRVTLENLTKEEGRLCTCWCQVKINHLNFMSFWRNVGLFKILATVIYTKYTDRSKFEVSPGLGPLFYDASLLRFVTCIWWIWSAILFEEIHGKIMTDFCVRMNIFVHSSSLISKDWRFWWTAIIIINAAY